MEKNSEQRSNSGYVLYFKSVNEQRFLSKSETVQILRNSGLKNRDRKLVEKCFDNFDCRQFVVPRTSSNSVIFFLEHLKIVCFADFCLIMSPDSNLTQKFIRQDLNFIDPSDNNNQSFVISIIEKAFESIVTKFRKRLALIKPPLEKLLLQIETKPDITGLKKLFAVKKSVSNFQQNVENVCKILKDLRTQTNTLLKMKLEINDEDDLEDVLDFLVNDFEDIEAEVDMVMEMMEETDQFVSSHQDNVRNELMKMGLLIEILAVSLAFGAVIGGIFGMNLKNHMEGSNHAFMILLGAMLVMMATIFGGFIMKYYYLKRDTSKAQSFSVLKNFFKCVDDLEFQDFPKFINKDDFVGAVKKITKINITDREADFLFQMVDQNDDGLIDTETELVLGGINHERKLGSCKKKDHSLLQF